MPHLQRAWGCNSIHASCVQKTAVFYNSLPPKTVFFPCRQPYSLPPYNPTTMTIPHALAKRPSINEKDVLPHNSHLCLLSSFTITTVTVTVVLIFLMKEGRFGCHCFTYYRCCSAVTPGYHCPLSTVHCCFHYYCHYAVPILVPSTVTATPVFLLPSVLHSSHFWLSLSLCTVHYALLLSQSLSLCSPYPVTVHCHCHTTVHPRITIVVHCPLSTIAFTITATMQALGSRKKYNL